MATTRALLGVQPDERLRVWVHSGEESLEELQRRVLAICQHFEVPQEELTETLYLTSGTQLPLQVARGYNELKLDGPLIEQISETIASRRIDVMTIDPLISVHEVSEQDNGKMNTVMRVFARLADVHDCAVEIVHHTRKLGAGITEAGAEDMRGASAIGNAVRSARALNQMSSDEASAYDIGEVDRYSYFRVDRVKANNAPRGTEVWRRFASVTLPNGDSGDEDGDAVGVVEAWTPPEADAPTEVMRENAAKDDKLFLDLLRKFEAQGKRVSDKIKGNYAPRMFAEDREARLAKVGKLRLERAMGRLMERGVIHLDSRGSGVQQTWHFVLRET
jgi:hypothetical protein